MNWRLELVFNAITKVFEIKYYVDTGVFSVDSVVEIENETDYNDIINYLAEGVLPKLNNKDFCGMVERIDWNLLKFQDYSNNFQIIIYENEDLSGLILNEFNWLDYNKKTEEFKGIDIVKCEHYCINGLSIYENEFFEELEFGDNVGEKMDVQDILSVFTIQSENFFRKYSKDYENYIQEKYA